MAAASGDKLPGLGPAQIRPLATPHLDWSQLKLTPTEGFVLSRVDGMTSYHEIIVVAGLPPKDVEDILRSLKRQGLILNPGETPPPPPPSATGKGTARSIATLAAERARAGTPTNAPSVLERLDDKSPVDPADLIAGKDLDDTTKARLIRLQRQLPKLKSEDLLGVYPGAGPKEIKHAYFNASKELHPDRYYGKDIGGYREILEQVFRRCSQAFNELNEPFRKKKK